MLNIIIEEHSNVGADPLGIVAFKDETCHLLCFGGAREGTSS